ncbi:MAG TPA: PqqD family protein [Sphingomicrobium sp.]|jgi:hypothetical protein|nr:PqqD family protein [Sphingomicrobium sp.]
MTDILRQKLEPTGDAVESRVGDETVLLHLKRGTYYGLDPLGTRIWSFLKEGKEPQEICQLVAAEFEVEHETVADDVRRFLSDLKANDIVVEL